MWNFFRNHLDGRDTARTVLGCLSWKLLNKLYCDVYEAGNDREIRVHKVNR